MSVLIKGFEKPDHCLRCPMKGIDDECVLQGVEVCDEYEEWEQQMANCPLVTVPPHGQLIDLSTVNLDDGPYEYQDWVEWALEQYQDAPVFMSADPPRRNTDET